MIKLFINRHLYLLAIIMLVVFDTTRLTPLSRFGLFLNIIFSTLGFIYFLQSKKIFPKKIKTWIWIFLLMMIVSITTANIYYRQSIASGIIANIAFYNIGAALYFYYIFAKHNVNLNNFLRLIFKTAWFLFGVYLFFAITGFSFTNTSELTGEVVIVGISKLSKDFVNFAGLMWFARFLYTTKNKYLIYAILFLSINHWAEIQRGIMIMIIATLAIGFIINKNKISNLRIVVATFFVSFVGFTLLTSTESGAEILNRFEQAFKIFAAGDGEQIDDVSTSIRVLEIDYALSKFKDHPVLGNGLFRASEKTNIIGSMHFYLSDIGFFGILYGFGLLGILVLFYQYKILYQCLKANFRKNADYFTTGVTLSLLLLLLATIQTGRAIFSPDLFFFYISLLYLVKSKYADSQTLYK